MKKWWAKFSRGDRLRILLVSLASLLAVYMLLIYPGTQKALQHAENMVNRQQDRIQKRTKSASQVQAEMQVNPRVLARQLEKIDQELEQLTAELDELKAGFIPLEAGNEQRRLLLLELSTLARKTGVELLAVASGTGGAGGGVAKGAEALSATAVDRRLGRPVIKVSGRSGFWQLLDFLDGMENLSYQVAVVRLAIRSRHEQAGEGSKKDSSTAPGALDLSLVLAF